MDYSSAGEWSGNSVCQGWNTDLDLDSLESGICLFQKPVTEINEWVQVFKSQPQY